MSGAALFPRKLASHFCFLYFLSPFYVGSGSKSGTGNVTQSGSGFVKAKSYGSCGSGSTTMAGSLTHTDQYSCKLSVFLAQCSYSICPPPPPSGSFAPKLPHSFLKFLSCSEFNLLIWTTLDLSGSLSISWQSFRPPPAAPAQRV